MHAFTGFVTESAKEIKTETVDMACKGGRAAEELTEQDLMEMSGSEPELDDEEQHAEEAVSETKLTLDNLAEVFRGLKTAFDSCMARTLL